MTKKPPLLDIEEAGPVRLEEVAGGAESGLENLCARDDDWNAHVLVEALGVVALQRGVEELTLLGEGLPPAQPLSQDHVVGSWGTERTQVRIYLLLQLFR